MTSKKRSKTKPANVLSCDCSHPAFDDCFMPDDFEPSEMMFSTVIEMLRSGIDLTRLVVDTELKQNKSLDRDEVFKIFSQSIRAIEKGMGTMKS
jgi:hypothetical protein